MGFIGVQPTSAPLTASDITDGIVSNAKLGADSVNAAKIADDSISEEHLDITSITGQTAITSLADTDKFLVSDASDSGNLKYVENQYLGGGDLVKIAQANSLTNTGDINIDNVFSNVYTAYRFVCTIKPVNSDVDCTFRWRHNDADLGASLYYGSARGGYVNGSGAGAQSFSSWAASSLKIADSLNNNNYNALHLDMLLYPYNNSGVANIGSIDNVSSCIYIAHYWKNPERQEQVSGGGSFTNTTVAEGFKFSLTSGDFDGYNYALFGYKG